MGIESSFGDYGDPIRHPDMLPSYEYDSSPLLSVAGSSVEGAHFLPDTTNEVVEPVSAAMEGVHSHWIVPPADVPASPPVPPMRFFASLDSGRPLSAGMHDRATMLAAEFWADAREEIIEMFPSYTEGLRMDRAQDFAKGYGLRETTYTLLLAPAQAPAFYKYLQEHVGFGDSYKQSGTFYPELDMVIFVRDAQPLEEVNGPEITETFLVHEYIHATSIHNGQRGVVQDGHIGMCAPRTGLSLQVSPERAGPGARGRIGFFLEEARAEYARGEFIANVLGKPNGFAELDNEITMGENSDHVLPVFSRYLHFAEDGEITAMPHGLAASALHLLADVNPEILPAFAESACSSAGLRSVAKQIEAIRPGLYVELRDNFNGYDIGAFAHGLQHVVRTLGLKY